MGPKRGCLLEQVGRVPKEPHRVARGSSTRTAKINVYWGHGRQPDRNGREAVSSENVQREIPRVTKVRGDRKVWREAPQVS